MSTEVEIRPEFLKRYRVTTNGDTFRVERRHRRVVGWLWWKQRIGVWEGVRDGAPFVPQFASYQAADEYLGELAATDQRIYDHDHYGWQPVEVEPAT